MGCVDDLRQSAVAIYLNQAALFSSMGITLRSYAISMGHCRTRTIGRVVVGCHRPPHPSTLAGLAGIGF